MEMEGCEEEEVEGGVMRRKLKGLSKEQRDMYLSVKKGFSRLRARSDAQMETLEAQRRSLRWRKE